MATVAFQESRRGDVQIEGEVVSISNLVFQSSELAEILRQAPEGRRVELVERAIRVGLLAIGNDMTSRLRDSMRFVQQTLDQQVTSFGERIAERVRDQLGDADKDGHAQQRIREIMSQWAVELKAGFEQSLPEIFDGQTQKSVDRIEAEGDRFLKQIIGLFSEDGLAFNELREIRRDFAQRLEEIKTTVTIGQTIAANPTPRDAGLDYEAAVHRNLVTIGSLRGDDVENTSGKVGKVPNCKKGDSRILPSITGVRVATQPCVAVEIRDRQEGEFSLADVDMMLRNREAQAGMIIAAHAGSLPKQYGDQAFSISWSRRLLCVVLDPSSPDAEVVLAAAYNLASVLAVQSVRETSEGDWDAMVRTAEAIEQVVTGMVDDQDAFRYLERKAHDFGAKSSKRHSDLVRLIADLAAVARAH